MSFDSISALKLLYICVVCKISPLKKVLWTILQLSTKCATNWSGDGYLQATLF